MSSDHLSSSWTEKAYAKVNLNLEVIGRRPDGYHELVSIVAFARDVFDIVTIEPANQLNIVVSGPSRLDIDGDNLVMKAAKRSAELPGFAQTGSIGLVKNLPVAAGLGGGSADAAATLRAIGRLNAIEDIEAAVSNLCPQLGADVLVCLQSGAAQGALMWGLGEHVWRPDRAGSPFLPPGLSAVLANPRLPLSTGDVFRILDAEPLAGVPPPPAKPGPFKTAEELVLFLQASRNDLEQPAMTILPEIRQVIYTLTALPNCRLVRMSGSGATCFGLFSDFAQARAAETQLSATQPNWWVAATRLS